MALGSAYVFASTAIGGAVSGASAVFLGNGLDTSLDVPQVLISIVSGAGFSAVMAWWLVTKTIPSMQADHRADITAERQQCASERREIREQHQAERREWLETLDKTMRSVVEAMERKGNTPEGLG